jgi:tetratricopeptide (TPR) repeat protein
MNIRPKLLLGFFFFSVLALILFLLPRSVVSKKELSASTEGTGTKEKAIPGNPEALHVLSPDAEREIAVIRSALAKEEKEPGKAGHSVQLAKVFEKAKKYDSAGFWYESAMRYNPSMHLEFEAGSSYFEGLPFIASPSKLDAGAAKVRKLLEAVPKTDKRYAEAQARAALTWVNSPQPMKGILRLRELAEANPENSFIAGQLGLLSYQSGQYEKAIDRFRKVLSLEKGNVNAWFYLSSSLFQTGRKEEAAAAAKSGLPFATDDQTKASFEEILHQTEK